MDKKRIRGFLPVMIIFSVLLMCISPVMASDTSVKYSLVSEINADEEYAIVMSNITPSGMASGQYALKTQSIEKSDFVMGFSEFDITGSVKTDNIIWTFEPYEDGFHIKKSEADNSGSSYLNISEKGVFLGEPQKLIVSYDSGMFTIKNTSSVLLRFTNSGGETGDCSGFASGTKTASSTFYIYKVSESTEDEEPQYTKAPEPIREYESTYIKETDENPAFTIACMSDFHADYGIQNFDDPIRTSVVNTINRIREEENANIVLEGGDVTSNNAYAGWNRTKYDAVMERLREVLQSGTESGRALYITGNHDFACGGTEWNSGDYSTIMDEDIGVLDEHEYLSQDDDEDESIASLTRDNDNIDMRLAYHYVVDGVDFIGINTPYMGGDNHGNYVYTESTIRWVDDKLYEIGDDKLVIILAHYPLQGTRNTVKAMAEPYSSELKNILSDYPKAIMLYGHDHGGPYVSEDTYERISLFDSTGSLVNERKDSNDGFVAAFMGSMSYYANNFNADLTSESPYVVQALMIYLYSDRVVFQMKNYGEKFGVNEAPLSYTLMMDTGLEPNLLNPPLPTQDPTSEPAENETPPSTIKNEPVVNNLGNATNTITQSNDADNKISKVKIKVKSKNKKTIQVSWNKVNNISGYEIQLSQIKGFKKSKTKTVIIKNKKKARTVIKKLKSGKKYYVRARAFRIVDGKKNNGPFCNKISVKVK